jgi:hypothetical protein
MNSTASKEIKKYLTVADNLPESAEFPASRAIVSTTQDEILVTLTSQGLTTGISNTNSTYVSSITSLVARWPAFDHTVLNNYYYLRIKSQSLIRVKHIDSKSNKQVGSDIALIPTDDERLKIIIIPVDAIPGDSKQDDIASIS